MKNMIVTAASVLILTASARAEIAFDQKDPAAGIFAQLKTQTNGIATPASTAVAAPTAAPAASALISIAGRATGDDRIDLRTDFAPTISVSLEINNDKDRVGAKAYVYADNIASNDDNTDSQLITYVFPGLRYDKAVKKVYCGDVLIARDHGFWHGGLRLEKGFELQYKKVNRRADQGFDRYSEQVLEVTLVQTGH